MKKLITIFFSICLIFSLFAGCGSSKQAAPQKSQPAATSQVKGSGISQDGSYTSKDQVAAYIRKFKKLPKNYITKKQAKALGWQTKGTLDKVAPGKSIGGDRFGNHEGKLPNKDGRKWTECDIDYVKGNRNGKRIVFSSDGLIYYTGDHYNSFTQVK